MTTTIVTALLPLLVKLLWLCLKKTDINAENKKKFKEVIASIDGLRSIQLKDQFDSIEDEFDRRDRES